jgi:hypothetical protein
VVADHASCSGFEGSKTCKRKSATTSPVTTNRTRAFPSRALAPRIADGYVQTTIELLFLTWVPAALSLVFRYRGAGGVERQQIKWFAYAAVIFAVSPTLDLLWPGGMPENALFQTVTETALLVGLYVAIGVAISRYRLYDIDVIINRTLVYASLTVTLVALYFGGVVLLQRMFVVVTGERNTLAVVASTLAIAALFNPMRWPHPVLHRPPLLPQQVRRQEDPRSLIRQATGRDGSRSVERGSC